MPSLGEVLGPTIAADFPSGYRWPVEALARQAIHEHGRTAGTVEIADYGTVKISVSKDGTHLDWTYSGKNGQKGAGQWTL